MSDPMTFTDSTMERMETGQSEYAVTQVFRTSSHPFALGFLVLFRTLAVIVYLLNGFFTNGFILAFVLITLLLSFDFWTIKNVSGRLLVGLRWWNEIKDDGSNVWVFESKPVRTVSRVGNLFMLGNCKSDTQVDANNRQDGQLTS